MNNKVLKWFVKPQTLNDTDRELGSQGRTGKWRLGDEAACCRKVSSRDQQETWERSGALCGVQGDLGGRRMETGR